MKKSKSFLIIILAVIVVIALLVVAKVVSSNNSSPGLYDDFAKCLTSSGAKMYGASWCSHCQNQKQAFGDSWEYIDYIECSTPSGQGQTAVCSQAGIEGYPTWEFGDGKRAAGELSFDQLSEYSNCPLN